MRVVATTAQWHRLSERRMKALATTKSPGMETLCTLYTELIRLRHEVNRLERTTVDIPADSQSCS